MEHSGNNKAATATQTATEVKEQSSQAQITAETAQATQKKQLSFAAIAFGALALLGAMQAGMLPGLGKTDTLTAQEIQYRAASWAAATQQPLKMPVLDMARHEDVKTAIESVRAIANLPEQDRHVMVEQIQQQAVAAEQRVAAQTAQQPAQQTTGITATQQATRKVFVQVYDDHDADGDVVRLSGGGVSAVVALTKSPQGIPIDVPVGSGSITIEGVKDGSGGITVGILTSDGAQVAKVLKPGESIPFRVF